MVADDSMDELPQEQEGSPTSGALDTSEREPSKYPPDMARRLKYIVLALLLAMMSVGALMVYHPGLTILMAAARPAEDIAEAKRKLAEARKAYGAEFGLDPSMSPGLHFPNRGEAWTRRATQAWAGVKDLEMWLRVKQGWEKSRQRAIRDRPMGWFFLACGVFCVLGCGFAAFRLWKWNPGPGAAPVQ